MTEAVSIPGGLSNHPSEGVKEPYRADSEEAQGPALRGVKLATKGTASRALLHISRVSERTRRSKKQTILTVITLQLMSVHDYLSSRIAFLGQVIGDEPGTPAL